MAKNLYETDSLSGILVKSIAAEIRIAVIGGKGVTQVPEHPGIFYITEAAESVPPFNAPIEVDEKYYIDARRFTTLNKSGELKITDGISNDYQTRLTLLERSWVHSIDKSDFFYSSPTHLTEYCNWLAKNLSHHFRLGFEEENLVLAACGLFYAGQHFNNITENSKDKLINRYLMNALPLMDTSIQRVQEEQEINHPRNVEEFCAFIRNANISLVFKSFDSIQLKNIIGRTFTFGVSDPFLSLRLAIEHPPAWLALEATIYDNTFLRNTILGKQLHGSRGSSYQSLFGRWFEKLKG